MTQEKQVPLYEYLEMGWRRKWWCLIPFFLITIGSVGVAFLLPEVYRSSTLILVEPQKVPEEFVKSAVTGSLEDRLSTIRQQILSRTLLQRIITELGLYKQKQGKVTEEMIEEVRKKIEVKVEASRRNVEAFTIAFQGRDPVTVMNVTNRLASLFIEENLKIREQLVEGTSEFLDNELNTLRQTLEAQEQQISQFRQAHMGELPGQLEANLRALDRLQLERQSLQEAIKAAEERKTTLEEMLANLKKPPLFPGESPGKSIDAPQDPLILRLQRLKEQLTDLQAEYKESYPDIPLLRREIASIERRLATRNGAPSDDPFTERLRGQLQDADKEIKALKGKLESTTRQMEEFEKRVENTPVREQELIKLQRDYENTQKNYQSLLDKKLNAKISENLEKRQKGEQFRIIDPANLPEKPFKPDRVRILLVGFLLAVGSGVGLVVVVESCDTSIKKPEEIEADTGLCVLASIPRFTKKVSWERGLVALTEPDSLIAEQYRVLAARIERMSGKSNGTGRRAVKSIAVTSAVKGEGKTVTALNLALVLARDFGRKILLVEGDTKNPTIASLLEVHSGSSFHQEGFLSLLNENLTILVDPVSPQEMGRVCEEYGSGCDYLLVDSPPIIPLADMSTCLESVDALLLVVRAGKTPRRLVSRAITSLTTEKFIGGVLNDVEVSWPSRYYGYAYNEQ